MATPQTQKDTELDGTGAFVVRTRDFGFLPIPPAQRYEVGKSFKFTLFLNILFAFATTFSGSLLLILLGGVLIGSYSCCGPVLLPAATQLVALVTPGNSRELFF
jgi:hypothetical protein